MLTREPTQGYVISSSQVGILGSCMYPRYQLDFSRGHGAIHQIQNANLQIALKELCFLANWKLLDSTQPLQNGAYTESLRDVDKQEPTPTPMQLVHMHGGLHPVCEISYEVPRWFFFANRNWKRTAQWRWRHPAYWFLTKPCSRENPLAKASMLLGLSEIKKIQKVPPRLQTWWQGSGSEGQQASQAWTCQSWCSATLLKII